MLLQPGQGMGLLGAYNTGYTPINPQMNHYNSLLGRIGGMTFTPPSGAMGPVANYFEGNTLMSGQQDNLYITYQQELDNSTVRLNLIWIH